MAPIDGNYFNYKTDSRRYAALLLRHGQCGVYDLEKDLEFMKIALVGLPKSGKTTIFNALTRSQAEVSAYAGGKREPNLASVSVEDDRVTRLSEIYRPKKTIYASVDITDFVGFGESGDDSSGLPAELVQLVRTNDAIAVVLRNFDSDIDGAAQPQDDLAQIEDEFVLADLILVENRLERIAKSQRTGQKTVILENEEKLLKRLQEILAAGTTLREVELTDADEKAIRGFQFLTLKPVMVIVNSTEENHGKNGQLIEKLNGEYPTIECAGNFEMELSQLDEQEEIEAFLADIGIEESARQRLTHTAYDILGYISFFTVGKDEVRAWNISKGDTALVAADTIHSDLARGFIRAECFSFEDFIEAGSEKGVKDAGKFRLEGKDYVVKDGDMICIRFNV